MFTAGRVALNSSFAARQRLNDIWISRSGTLVRTMASFAKPRQVYKQVAASEPSSGAMRIWGALSRADKAALDPFLMLDEAIIRPPGGFPDHPHRGFETVTYVIEGAMKHEDCEGHAGVIREGDVQWMTAGKGILHSELPATPGNNRGLQLWVNLAAKDKMCEPVYQELSHAKIPKAEADGVKVKVIAGESMGVTSPVRTLTPTMYLDFTMEAGTVVHQAIPLGWNAFAYVLQGEATFSDPARKPAAAHWAVQLGGGDGVSVWNKGQETTRFILVAGKPLGEPVAQYGPMVMNTREEVMQAMQDFQNGRNGFEKAVGWSSRNHGRARAH